MWVALAALGATVATGLPAQQTVQQAVPDARHRLRGVVHDSLAGAPLVGALVQLVAEEPPGDSIPAVLATTTDSLGQFHFAALPAGRYRLGFFHDMLDGVGIAPVVRPLRIPDDLPRRDPLLLAGPSASTIRRAVCTDTVAGVAVGRVRDASRDTPPDSGTVVSEWLEMTLSARGLTRHPQRRQQPIGRGGWFVACGLPRAGTLRLSATTTRDSTERVEYTMTGDGLLRRDLFPPAQEDSTVVRLQGRVVRAGDGQPVPGALVQVGATGSEAPVTTRSEADGAWRLTTRPSGSRTLEVRAVGFYPVQQPIAVTADVERRTRPLRTELTSMKALLDTVKVLARYDRYQTATEFTERRRSGVGRFLTATQIAQRQPLVVSDLFLAMPGIAVERDSTGMPVLRMRGLFAERCEPAIYVNGFQMQGFDASTLDTFLHPDELLGVEVYTESTVPPQFSPGMSGCGSLVFWTR